MVLGTMLTSCRTVESLSFKGYYPIQITVETDKKYDEVWDKVIDYFAVCGVPITTLEKASGLIVSKTISFKGFVTAEDEQGKLQNLDAFIVIPYAKDIVYMNAAFDFNVRIKKQESKVVISVNLHNIQAEITTKPKGLKMISYPLPVEGKSTGIFEKGLLALFQ